MIHGEEQFTTVADWNCWRSDVRLIGGVLQMVVIYHVMNLLKIMSLIKIHF